MEAILVPWVTEVSCWSQCALNIAAEAHRSAAGGEEKTPILLKDEATSLVLGSRVYL